MSDDKQDKETMAAWADALKDENDQKAAKSFSDDKLGPLQNEGSSAGTSDSAARLGDISMVLEIPVQLSVELGRTRVPIKYILQLAQGSVVELDSMPGGPMDVLVNGYLIAQGEVVVVNEKFGIRLTDVVTPSERLRRASKQHGG
jgi:flagellar motor switch protein FliN/FliY